MYKCLLQFRFSHFPSADYNFCDIYRKAFSITYHLRVPGWFRKSAREGSTGCLADLNGLKRQPVVPTSNSQVSSVLFTPMIPIILDFFQGMKRKRISNLKAFRWLGLFWWNPFSRLSPSSLSFVPFTDQLLALTRFDFQGNGLITERRSWNPPCFLLFFFSFEKKINYSYSFATPDQSPLPGFIWFWLC